MPSAAQAERTRRDAERDIAREGARITVHYDGGVVDAETGERASSPRTVRIHGLLGGYRMDLVDGRQVQVGDMRVTVADRALRGLSLTPLQAIGHEAATTGYYVLLAPDGSWPAVEDPLADPLPDGVRRFAVVALENTVFEGGYAVLRVLQCRG